MSTGVNKNRSTEIHKILKIPKQKTRKYRKYRKYRITKNKSTKLQNNKSTQVLKGEGEGDRG